MKNKDGFCFVRLKASFFWDKVKVTKKTMKIILYVKKRCPWCADVLKLLRDNKIEFEEREVLGNQTYFKELVDKSGQEKTPTMEIDGVIVAADSDDKDISEILKKKGIINKK